MQKSLRAAGLGLAGTAALLGLSPAARATTYTEASYGGDFSSDHLMPTDIGTLGMGTTTIIGETEPTGAEVDSMTHAKAVQDNDYVSFKIAPGTELSKLLITVAAPTDNPEYPPPATDRMFLGISDHYGVTVPSDFSSATGLLGWTLVTTGTTNTDVLGALGASHPAMFPAVPGATTFSGPLGAGTYTLWMLDGDSAEAYNIGLVVSPAPEPASWAMMIAGFGLVGAALRRRASWIGRAAI